MTPVMKDMMEASLFRCCQQDPWKDPASSSYFQHHCSLVDRSRWGSMKWWRQGRALLEIAKHQLRQGNVFIEVETRATIAAYSSFIHYQ